MQVLCIVILSPFIKMVMPSKTLILISTLVGFFAILSGPFLWCFTLPTHVARYKLPDMTNQRPPQFSLSREQISSYKEDGFLILRNILSPYLMAKLSSGLADLSSTPSLHCAMSYYDNPPIFHSYQNLCQRPELINHNFYSVLYNNPLAHISSQLMDNRSIRVLRTATMGSHVEQTIPLRWHTDHVAFPGNTKCGDGLVVWMPISSTSYADANGLVVLRKSNKIHQEMIENGTLFAMQGSVAGQVSLLKFYKTLENTLTKEDSSLNPGDVILFDRCTVHSSSGVNRRKIRRNAWQIRFFADPQEVEKEIVEHYPSTGIMDKKNANYKGFLSGPQFPMIWPSTIPDEQHSIIQGDILRTRQEWFFFMLRYPDHLFRSNFVRTVEALGLASFDHPVYSVLIRIGQAFRIL